MVGVSATSSRQPVRDVDAEHRRAVRHQGLDDAGTELVDTLHRVTPASESTAERGEVHSRAINRDRFDATFLHPRPDLGVAVEFGSMSRAAESPDIHSRMGTLDGVRWAVVRYAPLESASIGPRDGHRGYVLCGTSPTSSSLAESWRVPRGSGFWLPPGPGHRGVNREGRTSSSSSTYPTRQAVQVCAPNRRSDWSRRAGLTRPRLPFARRASGPSRRAPRSRRSVEEAAKDDRTQPR